MQPTHTGNRLAIIDYGMGNLHSVFKAFEVVGAAPVIIRSIPEEPIDRLVLPGVGSLGDCMQGLQRRGLVDWIREWIKDDRPFLGICLGHQALFEYSEEDAAKGIGVFPGCVKKFQLPHHFKIPHIGWNQVAFRSCHSPMDDGLSGSDLQFYFDHSYHVVPDDQNLIWGKTHHGIEFVSAIQSKRCYATQFHPEKSQSLGLKIYRNFLKV
jgi:glutamine amidotransferase